MTLEHVVMAIVVVAVAVVAFLLGRARGVQLGEDEIDPNDPSLFGAQKNMSLFGPRVPVQSTERQLIAVMPEALIVVDSLASVTYVSPGAQRFGIVEDSAMTLAEIRDILRLVSTDSVVRERELSIPLDRAARAAAKKPLTAKALRQVSSVLPTRCICMCGSARSPMIFLRFSFRI
mgnify:CR=1 FL=1